MQLPEQKDQILELNWNLTPITDPHYPDAAPCRRLASSWHLPALKKKTESEI